MVVRTDEQPEFALTLQPQGAYPHSERPLQSEPGNAEEGGRARRVAPREGNLPQPLVTNFTGEQFAERLTMGSVTWVRRGDKVTACRGTQGRGGKIYEAMSRPYLKIRICSRGLGPASGPSRKASLEDLFVWLP